MNLNARSVLPVLFGLVSLTTVACAEPTSSNENSGSEPTAHNADNGGGGGESMSDDVANNFSAQLGNKDVVGSANVNLGDDEGTAKAVASTQLKIASLNVTLDVLRYDFGVTQELTVGSTGYSASKASFENLHIKARPSKTNPGALAQKLFLGSSIDKMVIVQTAKPAPRTPNPKAAELASFELVGVSKITTSVEDGSIDEYEFTFGRMKVTMGDAVVGIDRLANQMTCSTLTGGACPCVAGSDGKLGPYAQAYAGAMIPKGSIEINSATIEMSNTGSVNPKTGTLDGKATIESIEVSAKMEQSGVCAMYLGAAGMAVPSLRIESLVPSIAGSDKPGLKVQAWDACLTSVESVKISGEGTEDPTEVIALKSGGVIRTDYDATTEKNPITQTTGWSVIKNKAITTCSEARSSAQ